MLLCQYLQSNNSNICADEQREARKQRYKTKNFDICDQDKNVGDTNKLNLKIHDYDICDDDVKVAKGQQPDLKINDTDYCNEERFNWGECFVIIIFPIDRSQAYRNAAIKEKAILSRYSIYAPGKNVGFSYKIHFIEGSWNDKESIGLLKFASYRDAKMWLESDNAFRQQDFLTHVDIWIVPINREDMSHKGYPVIQVVSQKVCYPDIFFEKYLPAEEAAVIAHGGIPFVVNNPRPYAWRGKKPPGHILINQFPTCEAFKRYRCVDSYKILGDFRNQTGEGFMITTKLNIDL